MSYHLVVKTQLASAIRIVDFMNEPAPITNARRQELMMQALQELRSYDYVIRPNGKIRPGNKYTLRMFNKDYRDCVLSKPAEEAFPPTLQ